MLRRAHALHHDQSSGPYFGLRVGRWLVSTSPSSCPPPCVSASSAQVTGGRAPHEAKHPKRAPEQHSLAGPDWEADILISHSATSTPDGRADRLCETA
eukprot:scaffold3983_cov112-Isochrysis_galbana.AAC.1